MNVLIAVDGSEHATEAVEFVRRLPTREPVEVTLMMVVNPPEIALNPSTEMWYPQYIEHQLEFANETLARCAAMFEGTGARVHQHRTQGHVGHAVVDHAEEIGADLVVVGARGHSAVGRILLGSVSDYVATHAHCSAMVVRPHQAGRGPASTDEPLRFALAVDDSAHSRAAVRGFARFLQPQHVQVQVVSAAAKLEVFREDMLPNTVEEAARRRSEAHRTATQGAETLAEDSFAAEPHAVQTEHIGEGIVRAAEQHHSHVIVLGDAGRGTVTRMLLGSTSRYVLRHAKQSVWIIRENKTAHRRE